MAYYVIREQSDAERFGGCLTVIIIAAIIIACLFYFAVYALIFFLALGLLLGGLYSLAVYAKAMYQAIQDLRYNPPQATTTVRAFVKGYWVFLFQVTRHSLIEAVSVAQNSFYKFLNYPLISFQKWMWLVVSATILVGEVVFVVAITALQIGIFATALYVLLLLIGAALLLNLIAAFIYTSVLTVGDMIRNIGSYLGFGAFNFSYYASYSELGATFPALGSSLRCYFGELIRECTDRARMFFSISGAYRIVSIRKWFNLASALMMFINFALYNLLFMPLYFVAFILVFIANAVWTTGVSLLRLIRH